MIRHSSRELTIGESIRRKTLSALPTSNENVPLISHLYASPLVREIDGRFATVDSLDYEQEKSELLSVLARSKKAVAFNSEAATPRSFLRNLTQCTILHFTGHGVPGALTLEDGYGCLQLADENHISDWFQGKDFIPEMVFISACHSESVADGFLKAGVPHVVAISKEKTVLDQEAVKFMSLFYDMLLEGDSVKQAFHKAKHVLNLYPSGQQEAAKLMLLPANEPHHERLFFSLRAGMFIDVSRPPFFSQMVAPADRFIGRELEVQHLVQTVMDSSTRAICVSGPSGIGKTQVIAKACQYLSQRHMAGDIMYVPFNKGRSVEMDDFSSIHLLFSCLGLTSSNMERDLNEELIISNIIKKFGSHQSKSYVFVFDGVMPWLVRGRLRMADFIGNLLEQRAMQNTVCIMSAIQPLGVRGEKVIEIPPLDSIQSAELFFKAAPRVFTSAELTDGSSALGLFDEGQLFARSEIITKLRGNPGAIMEVSTSLGKLSLIKDSAQIKFEIIPTKLEIFSHNDNEYSSQYEESKFKPPLVTRQSTMLESYDGAQFRMSMQPNETSTNVSELSHCTKLQSHAEVPVTKPGEVSAKNQIINNENSSTRIAGSSPAPEHMNHSLAKPPRTVPSTSLITGSEKINKSCSAALMSQSSTLTTSIHGEKAKFSPIAATSNGYQPQLLPPASTIGATAPISITGKRESYQYTVHPITTFNTTHIDKNMESDPLTNVAERKPGDLGYPPSLFPNTMVNTAIKSVTLNDEVQPIACSHTNDSAHTSLTTREHDSSDSNETQMYTFVDEYEVENIIQMEAAMIWSTMTKLSECVCVAGDMEASWDDFCSYGLSPYFEQKLGQARTLTKNDFDFLRCCKKLWTNCSGPTGLDSGRVRWICFRDSFFPWFFEAVKLLSETNLWAPLTPFLIPGLDENLPSMLLHGLPGGTFLFRLSTSQKSTLVICYVSTSSAQIKSVLIAVSRDESEGELTFTAKVGKIDHTYRSVKDLILGESCLKALYPNIPKAAAVTLF